MERPKIHLPKADDRTAVIGRTGSGKTQLGVWLLSTQAIDRMPWVIIDYKGDELIGGIERAEEIDYETIPSKPGVYILRVLPDDETQLDDWFRRVWEVGGIGVYVDEGYMIGQRSKWFNACLTQGRSKRIPMIVLTQRPLWLSRFVFSESSYFFVFDLTDADDLRVVKRFIKSDARNNLDDQMPKYHSRYYDVANRSIARLGPVPDGATILAKIDAKIPQLPNKRKVL